MESKNGRQRGGSSCITSRLTLAAGSVAVSFAQEERKNEEEGKKKFSEERSPLAFLFQTLTNVSWSGS